MHPRSTQPAMRRRQTVFCLHSSGSTGGQWTALRTQLEPEFQVTTPDFHGHGLGPAWQGFDENIVAADAARIARLVESVPGGAHLVGHSYGGAIALRVALHHPGRVRSVGVYEPVVFRLLFDYHGRRRPTSEIIEVASEMRRQLRSDDTRGAAARFVDYWGGRAAWQTLSADQQAGIMKRIDVITAQFGALADDAPRLADYRSLRAPTLVLAGSEMHAPVRRITELLRFALPNASFRALAGMGHMGPITRATAVARRIAEFIRKQAFDTGTLAHELAA